MDALIKKCIDLCEGEDFIFGEGDIHSKIMLVGEAPGENEIKQRKAFVGQAGKNLDEFLNILELDRNEIYITNSVKIRTYKISQKTGKKINRTPTKEEVSKFSEIIMGEIKYVKPRIIVTLGNTPLSQLTQSNAKIGSCHGQLIKVDIEEDEYKLFPLYHPASIIYNRNLKDVYLQDLNNLKHIISLDN